MTANERVLRDRYTEPQRRRFLIDGGASMRSGEELRLLSLLAHRFVEDSKTSTLNPQMLLAEIHYAPQDKNSRKARREWIREITPALAYGERAANGLSVGLVEDTEYGKRIQRVRDSGQYLHHGYAHERRLEREITAQILFSPEISIHHFPAIFAAQRFPSGHDSAQLDSYELNEKLHASEAQFDIKHGHGEAAALKALALTDMYQRESLLPPEVAREVSGISAIQQLVHERSDQINQAFRGRVNAQQFSHDELVATFHTDKAAFFNSLSVDPLIQAYITNNLDLFTLSPQDIALIALSMRNITQKGKRPFIGNQTPFGLHPAFEAEFAEELEGVLHDKAPIFDFSGKSPTEIKQIKDSVEIATHHVVQADMVDMIAPPDFAIARKFTGSRSRTRPFIRGDAETILHDVMYEGIHAPPQRESDVRRSLYELWVMSGQLAEGPLAKSKYIANRQQSCQVAAVASFAEAGRIIMTGDETKIRAYINAVMERERTAMLTKIQAREGKVVTEHPIFSFLDTEVEHVIAALRESGKIRVYSDSDAATFERIVEAVSAMVSGNSMEKVQPFIPLVVSHFPSKQGHERKKTIRQH